MSKVTTSLKAALVLSVLFGTSAHAQFGGGRGPVTKEGFAAHRAYSSALESAQTDANDARRLFYEQRDRVAARQKEGKYVSTAERARLKVLESRVQDASRNYGAIRDAGIAPYLPPRSEPLVVSPTESMSKDDLRYNRVMDLVKARFDQADTIRKMRLASSSLDGDLLEHIFPGKFKTGGGLALTGYSDRLNFLIGELQALENNPSSLAEFQARNASWLPRFNDAIAAQQLMRDKIPAKQAAARRKSAAHPERSHEQMLADADKDVARHRQTQAKVLRELAEAAPGDEKTQLKRNQAVSRWLKGIGAKPKNGVGMVGAAVGIVGTVAAGSVLAAGEADSASAVADEKEPATFSREEFRTHRTSR